MKASPNWWADGRRRPRMSRLDRSGDTVVMDVHLDPDLVYFEGHFPGRPILPGVAFVNWVGAWSQELFGCAPAPGRVPRLKFMEALAPGDDLTVTLHHDQRKGRVEFSCTRGDRACIQGALAFTAEGSP